MSEKLSKEFLNQAKMQHFYRIFQTQKIPGWNIRIRYQKPVSFPVICSYGIRQAISMN